MSSSIANVASFDLPTPRYVTARIISKGSFGAADEMAVVSVSLKLVEKGAGKPTVERTYLACT